MDSQFKDLEVFVKTFKKKPRRPAIKFTPNELRLIQEALDMLCLDWEEGLATDSKRLVKRARCLHEKILVHLTHKKPIRHRG